MDINFSEISWLRCSSVVVLVLGTCSDIPVQYVPVQALYFLYGYVLFQILGTSWYVLLVVPVQVLWTFTRTRTVFAFTGTEYSYRYICDLAKKRLYLANIYCTYYFKIVGSVVGIYG